MQGTHFTRKQPHHTSLRWLVIVALVVLVIVAMAAIFFAGQFFASQSSSETADDTATQRIIGKVENLYMLPSGEPTVAKVQNKEKLGNQAFFSQAQNGDYVLVYTEAKLALLYREDIDKLINVGPIALGDAFQDGATEQPAG